MPAVIGPSFTVPTFITKFKGIMYSLTSESERLFMDLFYVVK